MLYPLKVNDEKQQRPHQHHQYHLCAAAASERGVDLHLLKLLVDLCIVLVVLDELDHQRAVCESEQLRVLVRAYEESMFNVLCQHLNPPRAAILASMAAATYDLLRPILPHIFACLLVLFCGHVERLCRCSGSILIPVPTERRRSRR